jgi:dihydropteroate synthase
VSLFNVRVFSSRRPDELESAMTAIGAEWPGVVRMVPKASHFVVKVQGLRTPAVLILKEEMLAKGGDCAIHKEAITHRVEHSDCLLMGTEKVFSQMLADLRTQPFELSKIATEIERAIRNYRNEIPIMPEQEVLPQKLQAFYRTMQNRTLVMGILNVTPDSFSDGGLHADAGAAVEHGMRMVADGADIIDVGGESSRPGAASVSAEEELSRVLPIIRALAEKTQVPISIDSCKPEVVRAALDAGASIINDITGLAAEEMRILAAERRVPAVVMHMKGTPETMQQEAIYEDVVSEVMAQLRERISMAVQAGLPEEFVIIDPGIGFAKTAEHNLQIIRKLADFKSIGLPILTGTSRKAFIGNALSDLPAAERLEGTMATVALCINNGANIVRVHDVKEMVRVARMTDAVVR